MDLTLTASIAVAGGTLLGVIVFFVIILLQEIKEFKDNPLPVAINTKKAPTQPATKTLEGFKKNCSDSVSFQGESSATSSTLTLEMSHAGGDESREKISKDGRSSPKTKDFCYDNPCMDPAAADCHV